MLGRGRGTEVEARKEITQGRALEVVLELILGSIAPEKALARGRDMESPRAAPGIGPSLEDWGGPSLGEFKKETPCCLEVGVRDGGRNVEDRTPSVDKVVEAVRIKGLHDQIVYRALDLERFPVL